MTTKVDNTYWTLRFKHHKTTILLFVKPTTPFSTIKSDLLHAIRESGRKSINSHPLPSDSSDVIFGVPIDKNDLTQGWVALEIARMQNGDGESVGGKGDKMNETPKGAMLRDGGVLAFKFRKDRDEEEDDGEWDVVVPSYEELASQDTAMA